MISYVAHFRFVAILLVGLWFTSYIINVAQATLPTSGVYDENVVETNTVDVLATTGGGNSTSLKKFSNRMTVAHALHRGGVIHFDSGTLTDPDTIDATYGKAGNQTLTVTNPTIRGMELVTASSTPEAISGTMGLKKISGSNSFDANDFFFDFDSDDKVVAVGATILWQLGFPSGIGNVSGRARFSDSTSSSLFTKNIPGLNADNDTFWGFEAPAGAYITRLELIVSSDVFPVLDDLAFILEHDSADFNLDGQVDGLDFLAWQEGQFVGTLHQHGDANGDGKVNEVDREIWEKQYGIGGASTSVVASVPEPTTLLLVVASCCIGHFRRR